MDKIVLTTAKRGGSDLCSRAGDCNLEVATYTFFLFKEKRDGPWLEIFCSIKFSQIEGGFGFFILLWGLLVVFFLFCFEVWPTAH